LLAEGLGVDAAEADTTAEIVVERVAEVRDALGLPTRLRDVGDMSEADLPDVAADVAGDGFMSNCPAGLDPTIDELEAVLRAAW
jgi:alcohol dehydrogenase